MKYFYLGIILLSISSCKSASPIATNKPAPVPSVISITSTVDPSSFLKDEASTADNISTGIVMSDSLIENGFTVYREKITNLSNLPMTVHVSYSSSGYRLSTRMHEQVAMSNIGMCGLTRDYWKVSHLDLGISEILVTRADGSSVRQVLAGSETRITLAGQEAVDVAWIIRASNDTQICPFYSTISIGGGSISDQHHVNLVGASLDGNFTRIIDGEVQNPDGTTLDLPIVTNQSSAMGLVSDDGGPNASDRDFGCDGFMQSMN